MQGTQGRLAWLGAMGQPHRCTESSRGAEEQRGGRTGAERAAEEQRGWTHRSRGAGSAHHEARAGVELLLHPEVHAAVRLVAPPPLLRAHAVYAAPSLRRPRGAGLLFSLPCCMVPAPQTAQRPDRPAHQQLRVSCAWGVSRPAPAAAALLPKLRAMGPRSTPRDGSSALLAALPSVFEAPAVLSGRQSAPSLASVDFCR